MNDILTGRIEEAKLKGYIDFSTVFVKEESEEDRQTLYSWMLAQGYAVTSEMTLHKLITILCGEISVQYYILGEVLYVVDTSAYIRDEVLYLPHGANIVDEILTLKDVTG